MRLVVIAVALAASGVAGQGWDTVAPLPAPRYSGAAVTVGNRGYYIGGSAAGGVKTRTTFVYHPALDTWTVAESMNVARHRFGAAVVDGRIYVFGGWGSSGLLRSAECYDTCTRTWTMVESLPTARGSLFSAAAGGRVYAIGGWNGTTPLSVNEEYDPQADTWRPRQPLPTARAEGAGGVLGGQVFCVGGTTSGAGVLDVVEAYDPRPDAWATKAPLPTGRFAPGSGVEHNKLYVFGGVGPSLSNTHANERYYLLSDQWLTDWPLPSSRRYLSGFAIMPDQLYAAGGLDSLMQPTALVERLGLPMGLEAEPGLSVSARNVTTLRPAGGLVFSPFPAERCFRVRVYDCAGACVASGAGNGSWLMPRLAAGAYVARWQAGKQTAVTKLVLVGR